MKSRFFFIFALVSFMTPVMAMAFGTDDGTLGQTQGFEAESVLCQKYAVKTLGESRANVAKAYKGASGASDDSTNL